MNTLREILAPDFLLRNSVYVSLLVGFACPLMGTFLVLRRMIFLGVALPQISSTGVAFALSLHVWAGHSSPIHEANEQTLAFAGSMIFTLVAVWTLSILERRGKGLLEGRLGTAYVVATAVSILLLAKCPQAERGWLNLFKGEIIAVSSTDLHITLGTFAVVLTALGLYKKEMLLVSFDREMALTLKKNVAFWDLFLYLLTGLAISVSVLSVGPLISFGFLLIPALISHLFARNMRAFAIGASMIGGFSALAGFWIAYKWDLPVGPTDVAFLRALYAVAFAVKKVFGRVA